MLLVVQARQVVGPRHELQLQSLALHQLSGGPINVTVPTFPLAASAIAPLRAKAESLGISDFSPLWAGQNASGCQEISAFLLTRKLADAR